MVHDDVRMPALAFPSKAGKKLTLSSAAVSGRVVPRISAQVEKRSVRQMT